ncbi:MAG: leucine-rich repeat domain-containing protein [Verrucomicrobia bacterium]|nr:leucine-rich repeat domain-containing protein [Verrucomicrobiota bacterium]
MKTRSALTGTARLTWLLLLLLALPRTAQAQFNYTTNKGAITITKYTGPGGSVIIPDTINGLPVTGIAAWAFVSRRSLTNLTLGTNVTSIGLYAFYSCTNLTSVALGRNLTTVEGSAFGSCTRLTNVTVGPTA